MGGQRPLTICSSQGGLQEAAGGRHDAADGEARRLAGRQPELLQRLGMRLARHQDGAGCEGEVKGALDGARSLDGRQYG